MIWCSWFMVWWCLLCWLDLLLLVVLCLFFWFCLWWLLRLWLILVFIFGCLVFISVGLGSVKGWILVLWLLLWLLNCLVFSFCVMWVWFMVGMFFCGVVRFGVCRFGLCFSCVYDGEIGDVWWVCMWMVGWIVFCVVDFGGGRG